MTEAERRVLRHMSRNGPWFTMLELSLTKLLNDGDHTCVHGLMDRGYVIGVSDFKKGLIYTLSEKGRDAAL